MTRLNVFRCCILVKLAVVFVLFFILVFIAKGVAKELESEANITTGYPLSVEQFISLSSLDNNLVGIGTLVDFHSHLILRGQISNSLCENLQIRNLTLSRDLISQRSFTEFQLTTIQPKSVNKNRLLIATSGLTLTNWYIYQRFKDIWWSHNRGSFHFYRGWRRTTGWWDMGPDDSLWFHMDKLGHLYNARLVSMTMSDLSRWVGFTESQSLWAGALLSSAFYLEIELYDGQYDEWGFSIGDFIASEIGAFLPMLSNRFPQLDCFTLKLSYHSSPEIYEEQYLIEDYAGMTFWLSTDVWSMMPWRLKKFWPSWLNLALGYGITQKARGEIELYLALDYDLTKIHVENPTIRKLLDYLNYIHFPAPTLQLRPAVKIHGLYF